MPGVRKPRCSLRLSMQTCSSSMYDFGPILAQLPDRNTGRKPGRMSVGEIKLSAPESRSNSVEAAAMRALLEQWRIDVSWWRGGLRAMGLPLLLPPRPALPGGVSGSTPPLMMPRGVFATLLVIRYSTGKRNHSREEDASFALCTPP